MTAVTPGSAELRGEIAQALCCHGECIRGEAACWKYTTSGHKKITDAIVAIFTRLAAKPAEDVWRSIWVAKAPNDRLDFNRVYEREPSAKIEEEHERCGWKIVELKIRETSTTGEPKR